MNGRVLIQDPGRQLVRTDLQSPGLEGLAQGGDSGVRVRRFGGQGNGINRGFVTARRIVQVLPLRWARWLRLRRDGIYLHLCLSEYWDYSVRPTPV